MNWPSRSRSEARRLLYGRDKPLSEEARLSNDPVSLYANDIYVMEQEITRLNQMVEFLHARLNER